MEKEYTVKITEYARKQLQEISDYVAGELMSVETADKMIVEFENKIQSLAYFPTRISLTEEEPWHSTGIRKMVVNNYLVYFWINDEERKVQVTAVVYGGREQSQQLGKMEIK